MHILCVVFRKLRVGYPSHHSGSGQLSWDRCEWKSFCHLFNVYEVRSIPAVHFFWKQFSLLRFWGWWAANFNISFRCRFKNERQCFCRQFLSSSNPPCSFLYCKQVAGFEHPEIKDTAIVHFCSIVSSIRFCSAIFPFQKSVLSHDHPVLLFASSKELLYQIKQGLAINSSAIIVLLCFIIENKKIEFRDFWKQSAEHMFFSNNAVVIAGAQSETVCTGIASPFNPFIGPSGIVPAPAHHCKNGAWKYFLHYVR